ncbi:DUF4349 domain-containing protein [Candidatus Microgenomates bacterium]|jgi:hypothetical protein|nr:DUF4349 domain-containing protein [Candidatus Microgenomates bacterium]
MENKNILKILVISFCLLFAVFVIGTAGMWIYSSYKTSEVSEQNSISTGYSGRDDIVTSITPDVGKAEDMESSELSIMRNAYLNISVDDIDKSLETILSVRDEFNATYVSLNDTGKGIDRVIYLTIKVEETKFENMYEKLKDMDVEIDSTSVSENDVTETVTDLELRLKNYKSVETQLLSILKDAKSVEDTIAVYKELNDVRMNIESIESQLKNIDSRTEYSYITVYVKQSTSGAELEDEEWKPLGVLKEASRALVSFAKFFVSSLIWLVVFVPVIALVVVPVVIIQKRARK